MLFCDNGSEFTSQVMDLCAYHNQVKIDFSRTGKPTPAGECLDAHWFSTLPEACQLIQGWRSEYNASRPHRALGECSPNEFARQIAGKITANMVERVVKLTTRQKPPARHFPGRDLHGGRDLLILLAGGSQQHDPSPLDHACRKRAAARPLLQGRLRWELKLMAGAIRILWVSCLLDGY